MAGNYLVDCLNQLYAITVLFLKIVDSQAVSTGSLLLDLSFPALEGSWCSFEYRVKVALHILKKEQFQSSYSPI